MAYAAVVSLIQNLDNILVEQYQIPWEEQQINSLLETMCCFHDFLARSWKKRSRVARCLERKIRDAAYKAEDVIESYISKHFFAKNDQERLRSSEIVTQHLKIVVEEIKSIKLKVTRLEDLWEGAEDFNYTHRLPLASGGDYTMFGFEDDSLKLMERIVEQQSKKLRIIPVVGMGGIGKTTLVKNVFKKSIEFSFDVTAWVTVSQNYRERDILLGLLESMTMQTDDMYQRSDGELSDRLYKRLKGRRYLIVMDDMWHKEAWENIKRLFPDDNMGSRVLLTTRLSDVAAYANSFESEHHHMRLLNENESWDMLSFKVFGNEESCPTELEEVGKKIALSCKGLPLSVVLISGMLSKVPRTQEEWESIAKNLNSLIANDEQCTELLSLSYDHLPHHLKACFLYTGVFPLDMEIPISKLIKLWIADGLIKPDSSMSLEEVAEEYFDDLMSRNLVLVGERRLNGTIKTCVIHDLLKDWCLSKAVEEKFSQTLKGNIYYGQEVLKDPRRLCIRNDSSGEARADFLRIIGTSPLVRSLISWSNPHDELRCCKLLRVLDLSKVDLEDFPSVILDLVLLRYVFVRCKQRDIYISVNLPDALRNLQTLIICQNLFPKDSSVRLPPGFWRLRHLRHLQFGTCYFSDPQKGDENSVLENLQTLSYVSSSSCTEEFIKRIPNVKKLGIRVKIQDEPKAFFLRRLMNLLHKQDERKAFSLRHLMNLHKLEILKCIVEPRANFTISKDLTLPQNLIKLTLSGTRISWKDISVVGSLPNLEILKLKDDAFQGLEWDSIEGEFGRLTYLLIEGTDLQHWRAHKEHFPRLQRLTIWECANLEKIPPDIGNIPTLQSIELDDASPSAAESARQMKEEQEDMGNEGLHVYVYYMWEYIYQKRKEREEETKKRKQEEEERRRKEAVRINQGGWQGSASRERLQEASREMSMRSRETFMSQIRSHGIPMSQMRSHDIS